MQFSGTHKKMRGWARSLLLVEILVCFLPCALLLLMGAVMLPMQVVFLFEEPLNWEGAAEVVLSVACGVIGLCALFFVVSRLLSGSERIEKPVPVLGGVLIGAAPLLRSLLLVLPAGGDADWWTLTFTVVLPLLATAHVLFLSRKMFIAGFRHASGPLISRGVWIGSAVIAGIIGLLLMLGQGASYSALEGRRAYWMQHKPAAYVYTSQVGGWIKPIGLGYPKQVRVVGSAIVGASYTFTRGPGDTTQYPPPTEGVWTIDDLFDALLDAKKNGAQVQARFDDRTGAVLHVRVDNTAEDADWDFEVKELREIGEATARAPAPMFISR